MSSEAAIQRLADALMDAWNRGDAAAFGARYRADGTFTNVNGTYHFGKDAFNRRTSVVTLTLVLRGRPFPGFGQRTWSRRKAWDRHYGSPGIP